VTEAIAAVYADEWGRIVATLIRLTGDWDLAEECAQDAFAKALELWRRDGVPPHPAAWLTVTARNRALDRLRRTAVETAKLREVARMERLPGPGAPDAGDGAIGGDGAWVVDGMAAEEGTSADRLKLIFTCCHPALSLRSWSPSAPWDSACSVRKTRSAMRRSRSASRRRTCSRSGSPPCSPWSTCCSTRGTRPAAATTSSGST
jgi:hypothetical protein